MDVLTYLQTGQLVGLLLLFSFLVMFTIKVIHGNVKQYTDKRCVVCKEAVDWDLVKEENGEMFAQVDCLGVESLTENEQVVYEGKCCSYACYDKLCEVIIEV
jgi:hypothetical protein